MPLGIPPEGGPPAPPKPLLAPVVVTPRERKRLAKMELAPVVVVAVVMLDGLVTTRSPSLMPVEVMAVCVSEDIPTVTVTAAAVLLARI